MSATFSLQDCERKTPPQTFPVVFVDDKPEGVSLRVQKGNDPRTKRPILYVIHLTPGAGKGTWSNPEDAGELEQVKRYPQHTCARVEGIWIESGERLIMVVEITKPK